jgi:hypothetical protein
MGKRPPAPFVAIDCATIPGDLAESEPFGYEDSAFTGAGKKSAEAPAVPLRRRGGIVPRGPVSTPERDHHRLCRDAR